MSVLTDEEDMKKLERDKKIRTHLSKGTAKAKKPPGTHTTEEPLGVSPEAPQPPKCLLIPPLQPYERLGAFGRREQWRPMTPREADEDQDRLFMASQFAQDQVHAAKVAKAEQEQQAEQKATKKRIEQEARTGKRPYEPGRYISLEDARSRGFLEESQGR